MKKIASLAFISVVLLASALLLNAFPAETVPLPPEETPSEGAPEVTAPKLGIALSETGHFFSEAVSVEIFASNPAAEIYYTTDGSVPTRDSQKYNGALRFLPLPGGNVVPLKAIAAAGGEVTRPLAHTFFIDRDLGFDTLVFSLSTDPEHLYDYDTGILVEGRVRDEYIEQNPRDVIEPPDPANFNWRGREGERPVYVEVFEADGKRVVSQAAGVRVSGAWSRSENQKSLRLIARKEYEPDAGKFHYDFFSGDVMQNAYGTGITEYDEIILRNGANDRHFGMLRNEAAAVLAQDYGWRDVAPVRPAAVFLNGEYYGFVWAQVNINEQYLQDVYGAPERLFQIVGNGELWFVTDDTAAEEAIREMADYAWKNLQDDGVFAEFEALVDVDNLLRYYAFELYMGNNDWPGNNMERWRYTGEQVPGLAPELDGRWRYIMYDLDWVLGLYDDTYRKPDFDDVLTGIRRSELLINLLKRPELAERFSTALCDIAHSVVTAETVRDVVNRLFGASEAEIARAINARKYADWVSLNSVTDNHDNMVRFAERRSEYVFGFIEEYFSYTGGMYRVEVAGGEAVIGTQTGTSGRYFTELTVPVKPAPGKFEVFDHWVLNGEEIYEPEITVSYADARAGVVPLELVTQTVPPPLTFTEASASVLRNGCTLRNPTASTVRAGGLYVSNDPNNLRLWAMPEASVRPGETLSLAGKGGRDAGELLKIQMGFAVRAGDTLILSDAEGRVLDFITVEAGDG
ncbi:MAG: CotH kinase family protein [Oscillospiraceae bacterium]|jgi:hypothetical protein|nr:CotH kinase family protein [Oscillospiraceae bacterium]